MGEDNSLDFRFHILIAFETFVNKKVEQNIFTSIFR